jgi:hypothetical protein
MKRLNCATNVPPRPPLSAPPFEVQVVRAIRLNLTPSQNLQAVTGVAVVVFVVIEAGSVLGVVVDVVVVVVGLGGVTTLSK